MIFFVMLNSSTTKIWAYSFKQRISKLRYPVWSTKLKHKTVRRNLGKEESTTCNKSDACWEDTGTEKK